MTVNLNFLSMMDVPPVPGTRLMLLAEPRDATGAGFRYGLSGIVVESTGGGLELRLHLPNREMADRVGPFSVYVRAGP